MADVTPGGPGRSREQSFERSTRSRNRTLGRSTPSTDRSFERSTRGISTALGYSLNLAIATVLVTGLLVAAGGYVQDQQERAIRSELEVIGSRVAGDISAVDRLSRSGSDTSVSITVETPRSTTGVNYRMAINESGNDEIVLETDEPDVRIVVPYESTVPVQAETVSGGTFTLRYDSDTATVVVADG